MAEYNNQRYYWIKLTDRFMTSDTVDFLMEQKDGANYVVLYQMLCLKSINNNGELARRIGEVIIPYDEEKIQRDCKWFSIDTVRVALNLYKSLGLIYMQDNGILRIAEFDRLIGSQTISAEKKEIQRANERNAALSVIENNPNYAKLPELKVCKRIDQTRILLPNGKIYNVDEKRYCGNAGLLLDYSKGKCEDCGSEENIRIHHENGFSNAIEDLVVLCSTCHGKHHRADYIPKKYYRGGLQSTNCPPDKDIDKDKEKDKETFTFTYKERVRACEEMENLDIQTKKSILRIAENENLTDKEFDILLKGLKNAIQLGCFTPADFSFLASRLEDNISILREHIAKGERNARLIERVIKDYAPR